MGTHSRRLHISDSKQTCGHLPITKNPPNEELEEIHDTTIAHEYLEKTELIILVGQPISISTLSNAIHYITNYRGVSKLAINALKLIAFLLNEIEENTLQDIVQASLTRQLRELDNNLKTFLTDATQKISKIITNNITAITSLLEDNYTNQLTSNITDILQNKVNNILEPLTPKPDDTDATKNNINEIISKNIDKAISPITLH